ncbi:MAG: hypothetical protein KJ879_02145 [Nanoarchaeota archaeon]|nr:hypothetical protein [Nanoarchaeota archaeon]
MEQIKCLTQCPLINYCIDGVRLSPREICEGERNGDYVNCAGYLYYAEREHQVHNPAIIIPVTMESLLEESEDNQTKSEEEK